MRKIKFRVLNALNNMVYFSILHSGLEGDTFKSPIMQFTGLSDKNGVEIYEGDILNFDFITCFSKTYGEIHEYAIASVFWVDSGAGFTLHIIKGHLHSLDMTRGEVIGNIYENTELLHD